MRIAACQMVSGTSIEENVKTARSLIISAAESGAGIVADTFDLQRLLDFERSYRPDTEFRYWVRSAERVILEALEETVHSGRFPLGMPYEYCNGVEI